MSAGTWPTRQTGTVTPPTGGAAACAYDAPGRITTKTTGASIDTHSYLGSTETAWQIVNTGGSGITTKSALDATGARTAVNGASLTGYLDFDLEAHRPGRERIQGHHRRPPLPRVGRDGSNDAPRPARWVHRVEESRTTSGPETALHDRNGTLALADDLVGLHPGVVRQSGGERLDTRVPVARPSPRRLRWLDVARELGEASEARHLVAVAVLAATRPSRSASGRPRPRRTPPTPSPWPGSATTSPRTCAWRQPTWATWRSSARRQCSSERSGGRGSCEPAPAARYAHLQETPPLFMTGIAKGDRSPPRDDCLTLARGELRPGSRRRLRAAIRALPQRPGSARPPG